MRGDYPNNHIIENGQNTEKSPGDLRRFAVTQWPSTNADVKKSQGANNNNNNNNIKHLLLLLIWLYKKLTFFCFLCFFQSSQGTITKKNRWNILSISYCNDPHFFSFFSFLTIFISLLINWCSGVPVQIQGVKKVGCWSGEVIWGLKTGSSHLALLFFSFFCSIISFLYFLKQLTNIRNHFFFFYSCWSASVSLSTINKMQFTFDYIALLLPQNY